MENLILGIFALGCGIVTLLGWLWLSAERDLTKTRSEAARRESETRKLDEELNNLKQTLLDHEKRLYKSVNHEHDVATQHNRLRSDIAELRGKLDESQGKILEVVEAKRAQAVVQARGGGDTAELVRLDDRIAELEQELAKDEAKLRELDLVCERLAEGERMRQALREESARHQAQLEHWRDRSIESEESETRVALIQEQFGELLTMQATFAEAQRRFHDALVKFDGLMDTPSKAVVQTPTFEVFRGSGAQAQPISTGNATDSRNPQQPTTQSDVRLTEVQRQSGFIPRLRNLKTPKVG
jgi:chromosome segregation ATPase